jgi:hypothetical protein
MPITHKFFEKLSADDNPWGVEYDSIGDLIEFLTYPSGWVAKNIDLMCVLRRDFIIKLRKATVAPPTLGRFYMTGNSGTNLVTIFVPNNFLAQFKQYIQDLLSGSQLMPSAPTFSSPTRAFLKKLISTLGTIPTVHIDTLVVTNTGSPDGLAICHFSVTGGLPAPSAAARLLIVARHLGEMIADSNYIEKILAANTPGNHTVTYRDPDGKPNPPMPLPNITFTSFTCPGDVAMEYVGDEASSLEACNLLVALYKNGVITAEEAYIKAYS